MGRMSCAGERLSWERRGEEQGCKPPYGEMETLPPAWRRHQGRVGKDSPPDAAWPLRRGLQLYPSWHLVVMVTVTGMVSWSQPRMAHHTGPALSRGVDFLPVKVESGAVV